MLVDFLNVGDKVIGLVYGKGIVRNIFDNAHYSFEVEYSNNQVVPYSAEGVPGWYNGKDELVTVFSYEDICVMDLDFIPVETILTPKEIVKLRENETLMVRCPSGFWLPSIECPSDITDEYLENGKLHLFKKKVKS